MQKVNEFQFGVRTRKNVKYIDKVQKVNEFQSGVRTRKNVKYIDNGNICLGILNRNKLHLNRFDTNQLVKNYGEVLKT